MWTNAEAMWEKIWKRIKYQIYEKEHIIKKSLLKNVKTLVVLKC